MTYIMAKLHNLMELGQSVWLNQPNRSLIASGGLMAYIPKGVRGVISNPDVFEKSIVSGNVYDSRIKKLAMEGMSAPETYDTLVVDDIRQAADILRPVFNETKGGDGYVSLGINPHLAYDKDGSIKEAERLFNMVHRPNLMVAIPATAEGVLATRELIAEGVNVNVTLVSSLSQFEMTAEAYISALENYAPKVETLMQVSSVATFFVSRVDVVVDRMLDELGTSAAMSLEGRIGIANAKADTPSFHGDLQRQALGFPCRERRQAQRLLFGSTGIDESQHSDVMYMENLIGPNTVSAVPPETLDAFMDRGSVATTLNRGLEEARDQLEQLTALGIHMEDVTRQLLDDGIEKLKKPYDRSIAAIENKQVDFIVT
jgi:transaldolase